MLTKDPARGKFHGAHHRAEARNRPHRQGKGGGRAGKNRLQERPWSTVFPLNSKQTRPA